MRSSVFSTSLSLFFLLCLSYKFFLLLSQYTDIEQGTLCNKGGSSRKFSILETSLPLNQIASSKRRSLRSLRIAGFIPIWTHSSSFDARLRAENLYRGLASLGHEVHVFTSSHPSHSDIASEGKIILHHLQDCKPLDSSCFNKKAVALFQYLNSINPFDIAHSEGESLDPRMIDSFGPVLAVTWNSFSLEGLFR